MTVFRIIRISLYSVALLFFAASFVRFAKRNDLPDEPQKYFLPTAYLFIGGISGTLFTGAALASAISSAGWYCELLFSAFSLSGWIMILAQYNCFIEYDDDFIVKRGFFRKVRKYGWDELTDIYKDNDHPVLYFGKKELHIDYYIDFEEIVLKARKEYFERHRTTIPVHPEKYKTYNGVVVDPRIMIGTSVYLFGIIALFLGVILYLTRPISEDELVYKDINVTEYAEEDGTLRVYSDNVDAVMLISGYETSTENTEKMISDIKSGKTMSAGIYERKGSDPEYSIYLLSSSDGTGYLTLDRANEQRRGEAGVLFKIAGWFTFFWIFLMAVYIIAGRHPEKLGPTAFKILYGRFSLRPRR